MVNELTCPNCSTMMRANQRYGVDIDFCPSCKGVWLDRGEIEKIANASKRYDEDPAYSNERPAYSNERPGNYDDYPKEVRKYRYDDDDIMIIIGMNPVNMVTKRKNEDFSPTFLILINK